MRLGLTTVAPLGLEGFRRDTRGSRPWLLTSAALRLGAIDGRRVAALALPATGAYSV